MVKGQRYTPEPEVPAEIAERFETVAQAIAKTITMSEGARRLGLSRNQFQTIVHKAMASLIEGVTPKPAGRPLTMSPTERAMHERIAALERQNAILEQQTASFERLVSVATDVIRGRVPGQRPTPEATKRPARSRATVSPAPTTSETNETSPSATASEGDEDEDPEPARTVVEEASAMRRSGMAVRLVALTLCVPASTLRRWSARVRAGHPIRATRRAPCAPAVAEAFVREVEARVRDTGGQIGAEALRHAVPGVSRRRALAIKRTTLTAMERERLRRTARVEITEPGVVRGFDQLHLISHDGKRVALVSADAAVSYRTSIAHVEHYDAASVAAAIDRDFTENGAPLVLRADRAASHTAPEVRAVLAKHGVRLLHGPAYYPRYYGQLERQNREHRGWVDAVGDASPEAIERMRVALNERWPRRKLGWRTAADCWWTRVRRWTEAERAAFGQNVDRRLELLRDSGDDAWLTDEQKERVAIEMELEARGWLRVTLGGCAR